MGNFLRKTPAEPEPAQVNPIHSDQIMLLLAQQIQYWNESMAMLGICLKQILTNPDDRRTRTMAQKALFLADLTMSLIPPFLEKYKIDTRGRINLKEGENARFMIKKYLERFYGEGQRGLEIYNLLSRLNNVSME